MPRQVISLKNARRAAPQKSATSGIIIVRKLAAVIHRVFRELRLKVQVHGEGVPGTKLRRVSVVAPAFRQMELMERQHFIWRIANDALTPKELTAITMILTLTPRNVTAAR